MAAAPMIFMAISTVVSAYGAYRQGKAQQASAKYNQQLQMRNAEIAKQQAALDAQQQDRENRLRLGAAEAAAGASGGGVAGSALDIIADNARQGELQKEQILFSGATRAAGFEGQAQLSGMEAEAAGTGAVLGAAGKLAGGAAGAVGAGYDTGFLSRG